jgi:2-C-methyl-D-erythritol 2,4-cyclodiphosphate synthase
MMRIGIGYDLHRLVEGRPLILGGVHIPHHEGLSGHSDADALTHAIIDALLGAAALGNIGQRFPDTDPRFSGASSFLLLAETAQLIRQAGYQIVNIDSNIIAQEPRLNPYLDAMRTALADCLRMDRKCISVKVKTNEHLGPEGLGEAVSAQAVVLLDDEERAA